MADPAVYLAGPEVFLPDARAIGARKVELCRSHGFEGVFPLDGSAGSDESGGSDGAAAIFERCLEMMDRCSLAVANMTPFRGPSMDVGTALEIGYLLGRGVPIWAYTNVVADYEDRVIPDGLAVESFGSADNLMCEGAVRRSGGSVVRHPAQPGERLRDLTGFVACLTLATARFGAR